MTLLIKQQQTVPALRLKELCKASTFLVMSIVLIASTFFLLPTDAKALSPEANGDNPLQIVIEKSDDNSSLKIDEMAESPIDESRTNNYPDLGDDQVFPFAAGLDSY